MSVPLLLLFVCTLNELDALLSLAVSFSLSLPLLLFVKVLNKLERVLRRGKKGCTALLSLEEEEGEFDERVAPLSSGGGGDNGVPSDDIPPCLNISLFSSSSSLSLKLLPPLSEERLLLLVSTPDPDNFGVAVVDVNVDVEGEEGRRGNVVPELILLVRGYA